MPHPLVLGLALAMATPMFAQEAESSSAFTFEGRAFSSTNSLGSITRLDAAAGYAFSPHWSMDVGTPYYFINPSSDVTAATGTGSFSGLGNAYSHVRFTALHPVVNFVSTLTGTAPTGDRSKGLSTGHATIDWSNYVERGIGRLTPFGEIGIANAISDTEYFTRPYITTGFVTHLQGGARYRIFPWVNVGLAGYAILPSGDQTVVSRVVTTQSTPQTTTTNISVGNGNGKGAVNAALSAHQNRVFESTSTTVGSASIARDEGASGWLLFRPGHVTNFYAGYTRSVRYSLNTFYVGVGLNVRKPVGVF